MAAQPAQDQRTEIGSSLDLRWHCSADWTVNSSSTGLSI